MIQERAKRLETESAFQVLVRARELERVGIPGATPGAPLLRDIVHLEIGQPDFPTPAHVVEAAIRALHAGHTGYGPTCGLPELRAEIAASAGRLRGVSIEPDSVIVTPGAKPLLFYAIDALCGPGDEVIYPDPGFPMYRSLIAHSGARPVALPLREGRHFRFDVDEFLSLVGDRTRLVILNSPHNPTGGVLSREELEAVAREAERRGFHVLSDEVYHHFSYDAPFASIASVPGMLERTIVVDGFSKSYAMTGWRLGFGVIPMELRRTFELYNVNLVSCACTFGQYGAIEALRGPKEPLETMIAEFRRRRDYLVSALESLPGVTCVVPGGAFYAFPNIRATGRSEETVASQLLEKAGVAVLAGTAFGREGSGHLRLSYASSMERLEIAIERMRLWLGRA
jgi:aspartate aminotransferase